MCSFYFWFFRVYCEEVITTKCAMSLRSSAEDENGGSVGCGESANRIERMRATTDAVPVGHRILQTSYFGFSKEVTKSTKFEVLIIQTL